jgi:hypothetical protein
MKTNIVLDKTTLRGHVKRVNDRAMLGKEKAVTGETEIPLTWQSPMEGTSGKKSNSMKVFEKVMIYFINRCLALNSWTLSMSSQIYKNNE